MCHVIPFHILHSILRESSICASCYHMLHHSNESACHRNSHATAQGACGAQASLKAGTSGRTELKPIETSIIGALAGAVTGLATTPLDVIKTRLMTQGESGRYKGIVDCARRIYREEGSSAFLKVGATCSLANLTVPNCRSIAIARL